MMFPSEWAPWMQQPMWGLIGLLVIWSMAENAYTKRKQRKKDQ